MAAMPQLTMDGVTLSYDLAGERDGEPVVLVAGCGQPAVGWQVGLVPALTEAGYRVLTFDNRGVAPSSSPPAPYSIDDLVADTLGLLDHLGMELGADRRPLHGRLGGRDDGRPAPRSGTGRGPHGELQRGHGLGEGHHHRRTGPRPARPAPAPAVLRHRDAALPAQPRPPGRRGGGGWLDLLEDQPVWPNPGRLGQYEACLAWSNDLERTRAWPTVSVPCLVLAFEHDVDSPPARARQAAAAIPEARFVEIPDASHLGIFTHGAQVGAALVGVLRRALTRGGHRSGRPDPAS